MKRVIYLAPARKALLKHNSVARRIMDKIEAYAKDPSHFAKVKTLKGSKSGKRLRVASFRVLFEETADEIVVTGIGPRGSVYD